MTNKSHVQYALTFPVIAFFLLSCVLGLFSRFLEQFTNEKESTQSHMCILLRILNSFPRSQRAFWRKAVLSLSHAGLLLNSESERTYVDHTLHAGYLIISWQWYSFGLTRHLRSRFHLALPCVRACIRLFVWAYICVHIHSAPGWNRRCARSCRSAVRPVWAPLTVERGFKFSAHTEPPIPARRMSAGQTHLARSRPPAIVSILITCTSSDCECVSARME